MNAEHSKIIDIAAKSAINARYSNTTIAMVNDHVVRLSIMTEPFFWHFHPNSDESFLVIEGSLFIDLEESTVELLPNQLFTVPGNVIHRTRPGSPRSVNLTFESASMETIRVERDK
ncbi:cupin domain-containing protein [Mucilaginibacter angelicae]|uniref:Cupin domain-containing protein n=1 Tax=Mucilaginibacter angelicae TaxID=869718 RepID=A0ABV6L7W1_9SPHI